LSAGILTFKLVNKKVPDTNDFVLAVFIGQAQFTSKHQDALITYVVAIIVLWVTQLLAMNGEQKGCDLVEMTICKDALGNGTLYRTNFGKEELHGQKY